MSDYTVHEFSFQDILRFTKPTWNETFVTETSHLKTLNLVTFNLYFLLCCSIVSLHCMLQLAKQCIDFAVILLLSS